jgi:Fe-S-cluster containining protein
MSSIARWEKILAEVERLQRFMDMLCASAAADYTSQGGAVFCGKGCSCCCNLAVNCTAAEALLIARALDEEQQEKLEIYIENLKKRVVEAADLKGYLRLHRKELRGCPFLVDGSCGVYSVRPFSCRALLSTKESHWCAADFSEVTSTEKMAFIESLDRAAVAFPMHYLASTQDTGQKLEAQSSLQMATEFGFSLYGSMPVLVYLFTKDILGDSFGNGADTVLAVAAHAGLDNPFLLQVEKL